MSSRLLGISGIVVLIASGLGMAVPAAAKSQHFKVPPSFAPDHLECVLQKATAIEAIYKSFRSLGEPGCSYSRDSSSNTITYDCEKSFSEKCVSLRNRLNVMLKSCKLPANCLGLGFRCMAHPL